MVKREKEREQVAVACVAESAEVNLKPENRPSAGT